MEVNEIRQYVYYRLGSPEVVVELKDQHVDIAVQDTLDKFNNYMSVPDIRLLQEQTGTAVIEMGEEDRGVITVKTLYPDSSRTYATMSIFELMYRMVFPRYPVGDWYLLKSFYETYQRVRGTDPDWFYDKAERKLYVDCSSGPYDISYMIAMKITLKNIDSVDNAYVTDFKRYVVALCKRTLARIRGKFGGSIPAPGGALQLDAADLRQEGKEVVDEINEKLESRARFTISPVQWI